MFIGIILFIMDVTKCRKNFKQRIQNRIVISEELRRRIFREKIPLIIDWFQKNPVVKKAYVFGSILERGNFTSDSDLDIGVEGLKEKEYFKVWAKLEEITDVPIDLRTIDKDTFFARSVKKNGKLIYDRGSDSYKKSHCCY